MLKFKFQDLAYQNEVSDAIVDLFKDTNAGNTSFAYEYQKPLFKTRISIFQNVLDKNKNIKKLWENLNNVQVRNYQIQTTKEDFDNNFKSLEYDIEMETGTGKTLVFTDAIYKLNKAYDFSKFIIVVPRVAIREGILNSLKNTEEFFNNKHNRKINYSVYSSQNLSEIRNFSKSQNIEVMIITIDSMNKKDNIAKIEHEDFQNETPLNWIAKTNPVVIVDEPQLAKSTSKQKSAIALLKPLFILNFSATFRETSNKIYTLDPVDAHNKELVKTIAVLDINEKEKRNSQYYELKGFLSSKEYSKPQAKLELKCRTKNKAIRITTKNVKIGTSLFDVTKNEAYKGIFLEEIDLDDQSILLSNGKIIDLAYVEDSDALKRSQIKETIKIHIEKQTSYFDKNIKVLSLFFIDEVAKYRARPKSAGDNDPSIGKYGMWFEEIFKEMILHPENIWTEDTLANKKIRSFIRKHYQVENISQYHDGYFAQDKMHFKDTRGESKLDKEAYDLILKNKQKLISFETPLAFIFSHSALREGWDNPNVFQICSLNLNKKALSNDIGIRRQEIGRGLRLCFDKYGKRVNDINSNILTIITVEEYAEFVDNLQKEIKGQINSKNKKTKITPKHFIYLGPERAQVVFAGLQKKALTKDGVLIDEFLNNVIHKQFYLSQFFEGDFTPQEIEAVKNTLLNAEKKVKVINENDKTELFENNEFIYQDKLEEVLSYLSYEYDFDLNLDEEEIIKATIEALKKNFLPPKKRQIIIRKSQLSFERSIQSVKTINERTSHEEIEDSIYESSEYIKNQERFFIKNISQNTSLLRSSVIKILRSLKDDVLKRIPNNFEASQATISEIINTVKMRLITEKISFKFIKKNNRISDTSTNFIFYKSSNSLDLYDHKYNFDKSKYKYNIILLDSQREEDFAKDALNSENVDFFIKLQRGHNSIRLPFYKYTPDFALSINGRIYLIAEIKGSNDTSQLRIKESQKIDIASKYFDCFKRALDLENKSMREDQEVTYNWGSDLATIFKKIF